jgi:hypothetical protein
MAQTQANWRWCAKCACVYYAGNSVCHASGTVHDFTDSAMYTISHDSGAPGQDKWKGCTKCQVLSYTGSTIGACQAGGRTSSLSLQPPKKLNCLETSESD